MKSEVYNAFLQDERLVSMVGKMPNSDLPCIYYNSPKAHHGFPAVSFFESFGKDSVFADDVCIARSVQVQVDIWAEEDITSVFEKADQIMRSLGYTMESFSDVPDVNILHIKAVYKKIV